MSKTVFPSLSKEPTVSVVIPCKNEEKYIEACIQSILQTNYPQSKLTIYVCDGMSTDETRDIVAKLSSNNEQVILLNNEKETTPFALNLGLKKSTAEVKIILGAHSKVDVNFIQENVKTLQADNQVACAGGIINNIYEDENSEVIGAAMSSSFGVGNAHFRTAGKQGYVDTVAFGAYRAELFDKVGYFDEMLVRNQDDEFNFRVIKAGYKICLNSNIISHYYVRGTFKKLFKQYLQYGYWKVLVNKKHRTVTTLRQMIPPLFVLFLLFSLVLPFLPPAVAGAYLMVLVLYLALALKAAAKAGTGSGQIVKIIGSFVILHVSYGYGYLRGAVDFLILNKGPQQNLSKTSR